MLNKVILIGNVGSELKIQKFANGDKVCQFSLATTRKVNKNGKCENETTWHKIKAFKQYAEYVIQYAKKGCRLYVEGSIAVDKYVDQNKNEKSITYIKINSYTHKVFVLDREKKSEIHQPIIKEHVPDDNQRRNFQYDEKSYDEEWGIPDFE